MQPSIAIAMAAIIASEESVFGVFSIWDPVSDCIDGFANIVAAMIK